MGSTESSPGRSSSVQMFGGSAVSVHTHNTQKYTEMFHGIEKNISCTHIIVIFYVRFFSNTLYLIFSLYNLNKIDLYINIPLFSIPIFSSLRFPLIHLTFFFPFVLKGTDFLSKRFAELSINLEPEQHENLVWI